MKLVLRCTPLGPKHRLLHMQMNTLCLSSGYMTDKMQRESGNGAVHPSLPGPPCCQPAIPCQLAAPVASLQPPPATHHASPEPDVEPESVQHI